MSESNQSAPVGDGQCVQTAAALASDLLRDEAARLRKVADELDPPAESAELQTSHCLLVKALEWVRDNCGAHPMNIRRVVEDALATGPVPAPVGLEREALEWVRREIFALCEDTESKCLPINIDGTDNAFSRGRIYEAKGIRRALGEVIAERLRSLAISSTDGRSSAGQSESDEIRRLRIDNARLRDENFFLRRTGGGSDMAATLRGVLEMIRDGTDVPEHKREDTAFLRAGCVIANSMAKGALSGSQSPVATDIYEECAKLAEQCALPAYGTNARHTGREEARKKIAAAIRQRAKLRRTVTDWEDVENHVEGRKHD